MIAATRFLGLAASCLLIAVAASAVQAGPEPTIRPITPTETPPERVLFVGNSYLYYEGGVPRHLARMATAAGLSLAARGETIGDGRLDQHDLARYLEGDGAYDLVVLQEHSTSSRNARTRKRFRAAAEAGATLVRDAGSALAFYMTHAYAPPHPRADPNQIDALEALYIDVGDRMGGLVIPVGRAFARAYALRPELGLQDRRDGSHPTTLGVYLAAATAFSAILGRSPVGNAYRMDGKVADEDALFLQTVARDTVADFFSLKPKTN